MRIIIIFFEITGEERDRLDLFHITFKQGRIHRILSYIVETTHILEQKHGKNSETDRK